MGSEHMNTGRSPHRLTARTPMATDAERIHLRDNFAKVHAADRSGTSEISWMVAWDSAQGNEKAAMIYAALARSQR